MPTDFEQLLRDALGGLSQFSSDQMKKLQAKFQELAREALKDDLAKLHTEIAELRNRVAMLEAERAQAAAESLESSF